MYTNTRIYSDRFIYRVTQKPNKEPDDVVWSKKTKFIRLFDRKQFNNYSANLNGEGFFWKYRFSQYFRFNAAQKKFQRVSNEKYRPTGRNGQEQSVEIIWSIVVRKWKIRFRRSEFDGKWWLFGRRVYKISTSESITGREKSLKYGIGSMRVRPPCREAYRSKGPKRMELIDPATLRSFGSEFFFLSLSLSILFCCLSLLRFYFYLDAEDASRRYGGRLRPRRQTSFVPRRINK